MWLRMALFTNLGNDIQEFCAASEHDKLWTLMLWKMRAGCPFLCLRWKSETLIISAFVKIWLPVQHTDKARAFDKTWSTFRDLLWSKLFWNSTLQEAEELQEAVQEDHIFKQALLYFVSFCIFELCRCCVCSASVSAAPWWLIASFVNSLHCTSSVLTSSINIHDPLPLPSPQAAVPLAVFALPSFSFRFILTKIKELPPCMAWLKLLLSQRI